MEQFKTHVQNIPHTTNAMLVQMAFALGLSLHKEHTIVGIVNVKITILLKQMLSVPII